MDSQLSLLTDRIALVNRGCNAIPWMGFEFFSDFYENCEFTTSEAAGLRTRTQNSGGARSCPTVSRRCSQAGLRSHFNQGPFIRSDRAHLELVS